MKLQKEGPKKTDELRTVEPEQRRRFVIVKLEERVAPTCHTNPHGKQVGSCGYHHGHSCYCY